MRNSAIWVAFVLIGSLGVATVPAEELTVGGRVLLPGGAPLPQAEVQLVPLPAPLIEARSLLGEQAEPAARALTDPEGRFRLLAPNAGLWRVRVTAPGFLPLETSLRPLIEPLVLADLRLEADSTLEVQVTGSGGKPLEGALVLVRTDRGRFDFGRSIWRTTLRGATTGPDGLVRLPKGETERVVVTASHDGYAVGERRGLTGASATLALVPAQAQLYEVVTPGGEAVEGVVAALGSRPHPFAVSDARGRFTVRLRRGQSAELNLLAEDGRTLTRRLELAQPLDPQKPRRLTLPDRAVVAGKLIDADSRRPIEGGVVWDSENPLEAAVTGRGGAFVLGGPQGARVRIASGAQGYLRGATLEFQFVDDGRPGPTLALRPAAAIEGRLVDAEGDPVSGAKVRVERRPTPGEVRIEIGGPVNLPRNLSGSKGSFRLSPLDPDVLWTIHAEAEGFAPAELPASGLEPYQVRSGVVIQMDGGRTVTGTVVDGSRRPLRDVDVKLEPDLVRSMGMMSMMEGTAPETEFGGATDGEGRFSIAGLPPGKFALEAKRNGFAKGKLAGIEIDPQRETLDLGEIVLEPGERAQGVVLDGEGVPVEGVEVFVSEGSGPQMMVILSDESEASEEAATVSDPSGWFAVEDLASDEPLDFSFRRSGFVDASAKGITLPRSEPIQVVMEPASDVSGRVLDSEGEPIAGAEVNLRRRQTVEMGGNVMVAVMMVSDSTDAEGRFLFEDESPGRITLSAVAGGYQEGELKDLEVPKGKDLEDVELKLPLGAVLTGQVFAPDGRPLVGARVGKVEGDAGPVRIMHGNPTDGNGLYRLEGLQPGKVSIEAKHDDYPRAVKDTELEEGLNRLDLYFEGGVEVSGRVVSTSGEPVADAVARLAAAGRFWGGPQTRTAADGSFEMPGVQDGEYRLWVEAEGFADSDGKQQVRVAGEPVQGLEVRLDRGATIRGRVHGLEPRDFGEVAVRAEGASFAGFDDGASVDREGRYRIEHLLPGDYQVVAALSDSGRKATGRVTLEPGMLEATVDLHFEPGLTLSGKAVQGEQPVVGATVIVEGLEREHTGWGQTDHAGAFEVDGLEAGSYRVSLREPTSGLAYNEVVELGTSREIVLEVPTARVAGRIVDAADRTPLAGVTLTLNPDDPALQGRLPLHVATSDLEGQFEIASVSDGSWKLAAQKAGYAALSRPVLVQYDRPAQDLDLAMDATEGLTIEARLPTGGVPSEVTLAVLDPAGGGLLSGTYPTGENGRVRLSTVPPGEWQLVLSAAGSATTRAEARAPGQTVAVALQPATRLRIRVPELRESGQLATVRLTGAAGRPFHGLSWSGQPRSEWQMAGGELEFGSLPPGNWTVTVATADGRSWSGDSVTRSGQPAELTLE
jgi:uncharacterized GH25 family protein